MRSIPHLSLPRAARLMAALFALALGSAPAAQTLYYNFESAVNPPQDGHTVSNLAPGATVDGTINLPSGTIAVVDSPSATIDGVRYDLGQGLQFDPGGDGDADLNAPSINTNADNTVWGIVGGGPYTAMAWVRFDNQAGDNMVFGQTTANRIHLGSRGPNYHHGHWGDDANGGTTTPGEFVHLAYTTEPGGTQVVYVNGNEVLRGAGGTNGNPNTNLVYIATSGNGGSFRGFLDEVKVYNHLLTPAEIKTESVAGLPVIELPGLLSIGFTGPYEVTIELQDFDDGVTQSDVDESTVTLELNGAPADPANYTVSKSGNITTIVYTFPDPLALDAFSTYTFRVDGQTTAATGGEAFDAAGSARSRMVPEASTLPNGAAPPLDEWEVRTWRSVTALPTAGEAAYAATVSLIQDAAPDDTTTLPVINHSDPDSPGGRGIFVPDNPLPTEIAGTDDNNIVIFARSRITVPAAGDYTFSIRSDDGMALRFGGGATVVSLTGPPQAMIDPSDSSSVGFTPPTGDSNTRAVVNFPAAGEYLVELIWYEAGGGAFLELAWAPGAFTQTRFTTEWELVGDTSDPSVGPFTSLFADIPESVIPEIPPTGGLGVQMYYDAARSDGGRQGNVNQLLQFLNQVDAGTATFASETEASADFLNFSDNGGGGGGRFGGGPEFPGSNPGPDNDDNMVGVFHGKVRIEEEGDYVFEVRSDDGFIFRFLDASLQFYAGGGAAELVPSALNEFHFFGGTGDSNSRAAIHLLPGDYEFVLAWWEGAGGAHIELSAAMASAPDGPEACFQLIGTDPVGGTDLTVLGVTEPGWTVTHAGPGITPPLAPPAFGEGGQVDTALDAVEGNPANTSVHAAINLTDPQTNGACPAGIPGVMPWPGDTGGDDNHWAMRGEATLDIPADGEYLIGFRGDDGTYLDIPGHNWLMVEETAVGATIQESDPAGNPGVTDRLVYDNGTGNSRTVGRIFLPAGQHPIRFGFYEMAGGSYIALFGTDSASYVTGSVLPPLILNGTGTTFNPPQPLQLVPGQLPAPFVITDIQIDTPNPGDITITFNSEQGVNYAIEATDFSLPWLEISDNVIAAGPTHSVTLPDADLDLFFGDDRSHVFTRVQRR